MPFKNRVEAGKRLATALHRYKDTDAVVLALPRGGVPVAAEVANYLRAPLDLVLVRKVGVPFQPELAMGAVVDGPEPLIVRNEEVLRLAEISEAEFERETEKELAEIERRRRLYVGNRKAPAVAAKTVIIVDDGVATGATMRAALRAAHQQKPKSLVLAIPVAPPSTLHDLRNEVDDLVCLEEHEPFGGIGLYYDDFRQVTDAEVVGLLRKYARPAGASSHSQT